MTGPTPEEREVRRVARRLGLQIGGVLVVLLLVVGGLAVAFYERAEHRDAARALTQAARTVTTPAEAPYGMSVVVQRPSGRTASPDLPDGLPLEAQLAAVAADGAARQQEVRADGRDYTVRTVKVGDRVVQVAQDRTEAEEASGRLLAALAVAGLVGVLLVALAGAALARRATEPLAESLRIQRRFVTDAGHELRTPLTLLSTRVQLLARRLRGGPEQPAAVLRDVDGVVADTRRLTAILDDLLAAAEDGREATREPTDVRAVAAQAVDAARADARTRGVALVLVPHGTYDAGAVVVGSPVALGRAVTALVDNAVDHAETAVEVTVRPDRSEVRVTVSDDGPGIPPDLAGRVFERFASARPQGSRGRRHYGLGLSLVADVAAAHGGRVEVEPGRDLGAGITLVVPRRP